MVVWTWQNPSPSLALGFSSVEQQPAERRLRRYGSQRVEFCRRREKRRGSVVTAAKKSWEEIWEPREVTLDESDMAMLELRSLLGEPHDLSVAKLVAKKLNPSATNLEVEKIVKQKGTRAFLKLLRTEQGTTLARKPELKPGVTKKQDDGMPVPLSPKPFGLRSPPRQPGYAQSVSSVPEWPEEADAELPRDQLRRRVNEREFDLRRTSADDTIQLSPKPLGANASPSSSMAPRYAETVTPSVKKEAKQLVPKPVPELTSRPSRGGAAEMFPALKKVTPPKKDLPVPSLSVKPAVPVPTPSTIPEETTLTPPVEMHGPAAPRSEPGLAQRPVKQKLTTNGNLAEDLRQQDNLPQEYSGAAKLKEPDLLNKPVSSQKMTENAESTEGPPAASIMKEPDMLNKPVSFQSLEVPNESAGAATLKEPDLLNKPVSSQKMTENAVSTKGTPAASTRKEPDMLNKPVSFQSLEAPKEFSGAAILKEPDLLDKPVSSQKAVSDRNATEGSPAASIRQEPHLLGKPLSFQSQNVAEVAESNGSASVRDESSFTTKEEAGIRASTNIPSSGSEETKTGVEDVLPVLTKPSADVQGSSLGVGDKQRSDVPALNGEMLGSDEAVSLRRPVAARDPEAQETSMLKRTVRDRQPDAAGEAQKDAIQQKPYTQEEVDRGWALAEVALDTQTVQDVVFVGSNAGGMIVRLGCLNGFLPGKDLLETRGLKSFRSWARDEGHYVNHTSVLDTSDGLESTYVTSKLSNQGLDEDTENHSLHPACEADINMLYREHRTSLLASLVGERTKVMVTAVDKERRKLVFSERKAVQENPDVLERRAALLSRLKPGEVVKGKVRNISLFGVFVELVDGVSGLIRFSELSWSPVPDPAKVVNVGEEIEAVVHKLDLDRQRIYLSLKRMSPDPLLETVESMLARNEAVDSNTSADASLRNEAADSATTTVPEFEDLIQKLESRKEIQKVVKGRRLRSTAVVPSFQVYLSSTSREGYNLLARLGNEVQEVLVQTTTERDSLISIIRELTS